jgi:Ca-activated chloride channel family protein
VAGFGMILRESEQCGGWTLADALALARESIGSDAEGYRAELVRLIEAVNSMELLAAGD